MVTLIIDQFHLFSEFIVLQTKSKIFQQHCCNQPYFKKISGNSYARVLMKDNQKYLQLFCYFNYLGMMFRMVLSRFFDSFDCQQQTRMWDLWSSTCLCRTQVQPYQGSLQADWIVGQPFCSQSFVLTRELMSSIMLGMLQSKSRTLRKTIIQMFKNTQSQFTSDTCDYTGVQKYTVQAWQGK